jgi:hypothetical protein
VQRIVGTYVAGTLRRQTKAMRGLTPDQMKIVQQMHDDPKNHYSVDEARAVATKISGSSNPFTWEVESKGSYAVANADIQQVIDSYGDPTTSVVKTYEDLGSRVGYDVNHGGLTASTKSDLNLFFEASKPLHFQFNPYLHDAWTENLDSYSGSKKEIPLYSVMRSALTQDFTAEPIGSGSLNAVLKEVSGRPAEVHHLMYKAKRPQYANHTGNLVLSQRSESERRSGPGQHELMHKVSSGGDKHKFNVLYLSFMKAQGHKL